MLNDGNKPDAKIDREQQLRIEIIRTAAETLRDAAVILETAARALEKATS